MYCSHINIGNNSNPIYSCEGCYSKDKTLVTYDNGIKSCESNDIALVGCTEADVISTEYLNNEYSCTSCSLYYINYYSKFYQRNMCHNVFEKITKTKEITFDEYKDEESIPIEENGVCKKKYFTPDEKNCYKCDNENIGMQGCKGSCSFSLERNNTIICEDGCKDGYTESSKGICEKCENVNEGCYQCHYENNYPADFTGTKRERRFHCDYCKDGYIKSPDGKCLTCKNLGFYDCAQCQKGDSIGNYKCTKCKKHYALNKNGQCRDCVVANAIINNKCVYCGEPENLRIAPNKEITNQKNIPFEFNEIDKKAMCDFTRDEKLNADFSCNLEMRNETSFYNLTFKNNEIRIGEVDINSLNKINFSYEKEEEANIREYHPKVKNDNHTTIIVVCIVAGVVVICGVIFLLLYIFIWKKRNNNGSNAQNVDSTMYNVG